MHKPWWICCSLKSPRVIWCIADNIGHSINKTHAAGIDYRLPGALKKICDKHDAYIIGE